MSEPKRCLFCNGPIECYWSPYSGFRWIHTETNSEACRVTYATASLFDN